MSDQIKIYCDESGYTGRDMLSEDQPFFVYSACHLEDDVLDEIKELIDSYRVSQGQEVKGIKFVNSTKGQQAIMELFKNYSQYIRVVYHEKKYVVACKIIEHGIEPLLRSNQQFYESKLNEYLATGLYVSFKANKDSAEQLFQNFMDILKGNSSFKDKPLFDLSSGHPLFEWLDLIMKFDLDLLQNDLEHEQGQVGKEVLDLTVPSLLTLLSEWAKEGKQLSVICDDSNVFRNNVGVNHLNNIGKSGVTAEFLGNNIGYSLAHDLRLGDSKQYYGLQVADLVSSAVFFAIGNFDKQFSKDLIDIVEAECICKPDSFCVTNKAISNMDYFMERSEYYFRFMKLIYDELTFRYSNS